MYLKKKSDLYSFNAHCVSVVSFTEPHTLSLCSLLAKDKGEHTNSESTVYIVVVVCLYWLALIRVTTAAEMCMIYRHTVKHYNVHGFRKQTPKIWEKMTHMGKESRDRSFDCL